MGKTSIEWTDRSVNPIRARNPKTEAVGHHCEKISAGCANCYASRYQCRVHMPAFRGPRREPAPPLENGVVRISDELELFFDESRLEEVFRRKTPTKWFWCDMTDMFGSWVPDEWLDRIFATMYETHWHTHQVLTKRAMRMHDYIVNAARDIAHQSFTAWEKRNPQKAAEGLLTELDTYDDIRNLWPIPNIWLGVSVENQATADERIPLLTCSDAAVRFLSLEPLLGPVDLDAWIRPPDVGPGPWDNPNVIDPPLIDQVIVGGESGHVARPMHPDWPRSIRDQCQAAGVAYFFKQWGEWAPAVDGQATTFHAGYVEPNDQAEWTQVVDGMTCAKGPKRLEADGFAYMDKVGKKAAGRLLDGREWSEFPVTEGVARV